MNSAFDLTIPKLSDKEKLLHEKALLKSANFKKSHAELLEIIIEVDKQRLFEKFLLTSTFAYCTQLLKLSDDVTYTLIKISRASVKVPELKIAIHEGYLSISNAKRIAQVVTPENKTEWIEKAKEMSQRKLEQEVAKFFPKEAIPEKIKYVSETRLKLEIGLHEEVMALIHKAQDLISQKSKSAATIEVTLKAVITDYLSRHNPVQKAQRIENSKTKKKEGGFKKENQCSDIQEQILDRQNLMAEEQIQKLKNQSLNDLCSLPVSKRGAKRKSIPAEIIHKINLRDKQQCQARMLNGRICGSSRWLDYHHKIPVHSGGVNTVENLTTLCSQHHRHLHKINSVCKPLR